MFYYYSFMLLPRSATYSPFQVACSKNQYMPPPSFTKIITAKLIPLSTTKHYLCLSVCPVCLSRLSVPSVYPVYLSRLSVPSVCPVCLSRLSVPSGCPVCLSRLSVLSVCLCSISMMVE